MKKEILIKRLLSVFTLILLTTATFAQNENKISGKVVDSKGLALVGASIKLKDSNLYR